MTADAARRERVRVAAMELQLARSTLEPAYFHGLLMLPLLCEGDEVEVEPITWAQVRVGDIVTYRDQDRFPTRRVMEINPQKRSFVIMGDSARPRERWTVPFDDVLGRVVRRRRAGRWSASTGVAWRYHRIRVLARYRLAGSVVGGAARRVRRAIAGIRG
jgi:hypothetical protein